MTVSEREPRLQKSGPAADVRSRLMLVILCLIWGMTWPMMKISLNEIPPLSMRTMTAAIGGISLFSICLFKRRSLRISTARDWAHVFVASFFNISAFSLFTAFAQILAATSRVAILTYTLPIWTLLLAWLVLGERPSRLQGFAILLCCIGIAILVAPLATTGIPLGLALAVGGGFSWAAGTVYLKWARINGDPMGAAAWQLAIGFVVITACLLIFDGGLDLGSAGPGAWLALIFVGVMGNAVAYAMWFDIVPVVPTATAALGILGIPVLGVLSTVLIVGDRLTRADIVGFAFIFAASACVLLFPHGPKRATP
ncbi:MAG: DMT family transporter [Xanthobacteraceae bacterium]